MFRRWYPGSFAPATRGVDDALVCHDEDACWQADGRCIPCDEAGAPNRLVSHGSEVLRLQRVLQLHVVHVEVAADGHEHRTPVGLVEDGFAGRARLDAEERRQFGNGRCSRSGNLLEWPGVAGNRRRPPKIGLFGVRRVAAALAAKDRVLADLRQVHELLAVLAPDGAGIRLDGDNGDTCPREDSQVCLEGGVVRAVEPLPVGVEAVGIHHDELAQADETAARPNLVAEFRLDLVEGERKVAVALDVASGEEAHHLFVRGAEGEPPLAPVLKAEQHRAEGAVPPRLLPELDRLERWKVNLEGARAVHLFADDGLDAPGDPPTKRREAVEAGCQGDDEPRAEQETVARRLRFGGRLPQRPYDESGHPHRLVPAGVRAAQGFPT